MYVNKPFWSVDTMFYTEMKLPNVAKFVYHFVKAKDRLVYIYAVVFQSYLQQTHCKEVDEESVRAFFFSPIVSKPMSRLCVHYKKMIPLYVLSKFHLLYLLQIYAKIYHLVYQYRMIME